jgi:hypothetical protein
MESLRKFYCALRGHEEYLRFDKSRVYLQCVSCGHESPGWTVEHTSRPARRFQARPLTTRAGALIGKIA